MSPELCFPAVDQLGRPWPWLGEGLRASLLQWHAADRFPATCVIVHQIRTHSVDSSLYSFQMALMLMLMLIAAHGQREPASMSSLLLLPTRPLPSALQLLVDAGHHGQAIELARALRQPEHQRSLVQAAALMMPLPAYLDVLAGFAPLRCSAALQAVSDSEQQRLRAVLADPPKDWLRPRFQEGLALLEEPLHHDWQHAAETLGTLQRAASIAGQGWQHPWRLRLRLLGALG